jgi:Prolyl oligopeptidase family
MNLPGLNPGGYVNASISNVSAFDKVDYLLAHGSGDDNVHFANSAHLLDMFTKAHIRKYQFRMFTDRYVMRDSRRGLIKKRYLDPELMMGRSHPLFPSTVTMEFRGGVPFVNCLST